MFRFPLLLLMFSNSFRSYFTLSLSVIVIIITSWSCTTSSTISSTQNLRLGDDYNNKNQYDQAIYYYKKYLEQAPSLGLYRNPLREAEVHRKLAHAWSTQGQYRNAFNSLQEALTVYGKIGIKCWICKGEVLGKRDLSPNIGVDTDKRGRGKGRRGGDRRRN